MNYDYNPMTTVVPRVEPLEERFRRRARLAVCALTDASGWSRTSTLEVLMALGLVDYDGKIPVVAMP